MFNNKELEKRIYDLKNDLQELTDFVCLCIDNLPKEVKDRKINEYLDVSLKNCPDLVKYIFMKLYDLNINEETVSTYIEKDSTWIIIGTPFDTLEKLVNTYLFEHEKRGSLFLSCPHCQERFLLECTTSEEYTHVCQKCGKYLRLKVTSKNINITVA